MPINQGLINQYRKGKAGLLNNWMAQFQPISYALPEDVLTPSALPEETTEPQPSPAPDAPTPDPGTLPSPQPIYPSTSIGLGDYGGALLGGLKSIGQMSPTFQALNAAKGLLGFGQPQQPAGGLLNMAQIQGLMPTSSGAPVGPAPAEVIGLLNQPAQLPGGFSQSPSLPPGIISVNNAVGSFFGPAGAAPFSAADAAYFDSVSGGIGY